MFIHSFFCLPENTYSLCLLCSNKVYIVRAISHLRPLYGPRREMHKKFHARGMSWRCTSTSHVPKSYYKKTHVAKLISYVPKSACTESVHPFVPKVSCTESGLTHTNYRRNEIVACMDNATTCRAHEILQLNRRNACSLTEKLN